jgi:excisionase family DNA binding protein
MMLLSEKDLRRIVGEAVRAELANANHQPTSEYLTAEQVGEMLGVHSRSVAKYVQREGLPAVRAGAHYRFRREAVIAWLEERSVKSGAHVTRHVERLRKLK